MAMAQAESTSVSCSGPVRVVLIGHSYVRRLQEFCDQHPELHNLGFPGQDAIVRSFARGDSDNDRWVNCQLQPALRCRPTIVYLHIGENDILHLMLMCLSTSCGRWCSTSGQWLTLGPSSSASFCGFRHTRTGRSRSHW